MSRPIASTCGTRTDRYIARRTTATPRASVRAEDLRVPSTVLALLRRALGLMPHSSDEEVIQALARSGASGEP